MNPKQLGYDNNTQTTHWRQLIMNRKTIAENLASGDIARQKELRQISAKPSFGPLKNNILVQMAEALAKKKLVNFQEIKIGDLTLLVPLVSSFTLTFDPEQMNRAPERVCILPKDSEASIPGLNIDDPSLYLSIIQASGEADDLAFPTQEQVEQLLVDKATLLNELNYFATISPEFLNPSLVYATSPYSTRHPQVTLGMYLKEPFGVFSLNEINIETGEKTYLDTEFERIGRGIVVYPLLVRKERH
jgi:hypothetical protein